MKIYLSALLIISLFSSIGHTNQIQTDIKGFIALEAIKMIHQRDRETAFSTGIGVLDLKFYAQHDQLSSKIKLDLDGDLSESYNLFEEVTVSYRFNQLLRITMGKGLVPFHQKHFGVLESAYIDGGSVIGSNNSWRDQDRKIVAILEIGRKSVGFVNSITFYGDTLQIEKDQDKQPKLDLSGRRPIIKTKQAKTFRTDEERGFANKFEIFIKNFALYTSAIHYRNDVYPYESYAF